MIKRDMGKGILAGQLSRFDEIGERAEEKPAWKRRAGFNHNRVKEPGSQIRERSPALRLFLMDNQLESFTIFSQGMRRVRLLDLATIGALIFDISIILYYTRKISTPISHLGVEAKKIAEGLFDDSILMVEGDDEIDTRVFNWKRGRGLPSPSSIERHHE
jgi:methyl-accepting chemotaxis protein